MRQIIFHQAGINLFHLQEKRVILQSLIGLGRGTMIILLAASSIYMSALQAGIAAPSMAFRGCLKDAATKAKTEKVGADAIEGYLKNACSTQMGSLREALIAFRMKNGMSRKEADSDAALTVNDYVATPADNYRFIVKREAAAEAPAPAPSPKPVVTPASVSTTPASQPPKP